MLSKSLELVIYPPEKEAIKKNLHLFHRQTYVGHDDMGVRGHWVNFIVDDQVVVMDKKVFPIMIPYHRSVWVLFFDYATGGDAVEVSTVVNTDYVVQVV